MPWEALGQVAAVCCRAADSNACGCASGGYGSDGDPFLLPRLSMMRTDFTAGVSEMYCEQIVPARDSPFAAVTRIWKGPAMRFQRMP